MPGHDVTFPRRQLNSLRTASSELYIGDLALLVYGRETLSNSSLTRRKSGAHKDVESKPQLDNTKLDAILGECISFKTKLILKLNPYILFPPFFY